MLELRGLTVRYGDRRILDGVSLSLGQGQWVMLVGPNGAGKTTLVAAVSQRIRYGGEVRVLGEDAGKLRPRELARRLGVLAQRLHVGYAFTVEEVVRLGRYAHGGAWLGGGDPRGTERVEEALRLTGMEGLRSQSVTTLSGGELQRTFLAQVLAQDPDILVLDEPANHLDPAQQKAIFELIGRWLGTGRRAVLSVVHDLSVARMYGTHAAVLSRGALVASGECSRILNRENLEETYGMDVVGWIRQMQSQWNGGP